MAWQPDPSMIQFATDFGSADMGDADNDEVHQCEFGLPSRWQLLFVRVHFTGPGTGTANMDVVLKSRLGDSWNAKLYTIEARGIGADVHFRIPPDELLHWTFEAGDKLVLEWTNPDVSDDIQWALEVGMLPVE